jgi:hypothetical protein
MKRGNVLHSGIPHGIDMRPRCQQLANPSHVCLAEFTHFVLAIRGNKFELIDNHSLRK